MVGSRGSRASLLPTGKAAPKLHREDIVRLLHIPSRDAVASSISRRFCSVGRDGLLGA